MGQFSSFGLKKFLNDGLVDLKFSEPTLVQEQVIPLLQKHQNVICLANTGTGKSHAFILPILNNLDYQLNRIQSVIVTPTRELAKQIYENIRFFKTYQPELQVGCFIGGEDIKRQVEQLQKSQPQIIVVTPTRLKDLFLADALNFGKLSSFIIDECDMIFDLGFIDDVDYILSKVNNDVKVSVFSATIAEALKPFLLKYLKNPHFIDVNKSTVTNQNIEHVLIPTKHQDRGKVLLKVLATINPYLCIIFVNRREEIPGYFDLLRENGYSVCQLHAGLEPRLRTQMVKRIKNLEFKYVIATDVAARGIDLDGVSHVISIDLPNNLEYYIHRSGRTGRGQYTGKSYVLYDTKNLNLVKQLEQWGITFEYQKWNSSNELVTINLEPVRKKYQPQTTTNEVNKIINRYKTKNNNKKVKPGYKKKRKEEIDNLTKQIRREHIKNSIKKIKKEKAKERGKKLFDKD
ncbi:ATP-dependent RNA helicase [Spiroplasma syrphidicola EA-1]|uniref:ATP-dependent RNA helicase n=1 Tax=Spiroplasma syrphidicola EA-1 TaxID=1276229 RepID=R4UIF5_9MOLU|nr:DEAD/DEAH box helicase [Spiroplasma syrphidicola]AGM25950.1 ATP-dependent RNA helicase [Spiroplasma syrphidicola EA-1]